MDLLDAVLYTLARIGIMIVLVLFGAFAGYILIPSVVTLLPSSAVGFKEFMTDPSTQSVISLIITALFLTALFYDDGKRQAAYESWSWVNITIVFLLMIFVYFIPAIFRDSFSAEGKAEVFYRTLYSPCRWLYEGMGMNFLISVIVGMGMILVIAFISYVTAFKIYVRKHPIILKNMSRSSLVSEEEDTESNEESEEDVN